MDKVDQILKNHSRHGVKVKTLRLDLYECKHISASCLDSWLQIAANSEIKDLGLELSPYMQEKYSFPCSIFSDKAVANSIQSLYLVACNFNPTTTLGYLSRLKNLYMYGVGITEEALGLLFSRSSALEWLEMYDNREIVCLRIPCTLQRLKILRIKGCKMMRAVEIGGPKLSDLYYSGPSAEIYIKDSSQLKVVELSFGQSCILLPHARAKLPYITAGVESLTLHSLAENVSIAMLPSKFLSLRKLEITLLRSDTFFSVGYDLLSLVSFLDASPALDSFILRVESDALRHCGGVSRKPEYRHDRLRQVMIAGFCSAKSLIELVICILECSTSLKRLTLDTTPGYDRRSGYIRKCPGSSEIGSCRPMTKRALAEAPKAVEAANRYIAGSVPSAVEFQVLEHCSRCHTGSR